MALFQILARDGGAPFLHEVVMEEIRGEIVEFQERFLLVAPGFARALFILQFDARPLREPADSGDEIEVLVFHHEGEHVAARAATEAVPDLLLRVDIEARRLFLVEWAEGAEVCPRTLEREIRADHLDNVVVLANLLKNGFGNNARHGLVGKRFVIGFYLATAAQQPTTIS